MNALTRVHLWTINYELDINLQKFQYFLKIWLQR